VTRADVRRLGRKPHVQRVSGAWVCAHPRLGSFQLYFSGYFGTGESPVAAFQDAKAFCIPALKTRPPGAGVLDFAATS
jgi:hypothetical protein